MKFERDSRLPAPVFAQDTGEDRFQERARSAQVYDNLPEFGQPARRGIQVSPHHSAAIIRYRCAGG